MPGIMQFLRCIFLVLIGTGVIWQLNAAPYATAVSDHDFLSQQHARDQQQYIRPFFSKKINLNEIRWQNAHVVVSAIDQLEARDLQLTYMQQRYYDPVIGRFYSNDPVGTSEHLKGTNGPHGFNRYAYANNNPYKFIDPDGRSSYNPQGLSQNISDFNKVRIENGVSNTEALGDITGVNDVVDATKALANGDIGGALLSAAAVIAKPLKAVKMQQKVEKGQAPKGIDRFDKSEKSVPDSKDHVHFKDGTSMNNDGSVHDKKSGTPNPTNTEKKFLEKNGWPTEVKK